MSYRVTYRVDGDIIIDRSLLSMLHPTTTENRRMAELQQLSEDVMTVTQMKELQQLQKNSLWRTIDFNGVKITTYSQMIEQDAALYIASDLKSAFIPGYEGQNLTFELDENQNLKIKNPYFDDNYDNNLSLVTDVAKAFHSNIKIVCVGDETNDPDHVNEVVYKS